MGFSGSNLELGPKNNNAEKSFFFKQNKREIPVFGKYGQKTIYSTRQEFDEAKVATVKGRKKGKEGRKESERKEQGRIQMQHRG